LRRSCGRDARRCRSENDRKKDIHGNNEAIEGLVQQQRRRVRRVALRGRQRRLRCDVGRTGVAKEPGTDQFAARFHAAGFSVLAFDVRRFGESGGTPRQVLRVREQLADWGSGLRFPARPAAVGG
jgi:hypothetical protein